MMSFMKKEWKDLTRLQKTVFILSSLIFVGTLVYVGMNFEGLKVRHDSFVEGPCTYYFENGYLRDIDCPGFPMLEDMSDYGDNYTVVDFYEYKEQQRKDLDTAPDFGR